jgi:hypothetical protein
VVYVERNVQRWISKNNNLWAVIVSISFFILGSVIFVITYGTTNTSSALIGQIGISFIAIGSLSFVWQLFLTRQFKDEVYAMVNISDNLISSGITEINEDFSLIDWKTLFDSVINSIDIFFMSGQGWTKQNRTLLQNISKKDVKVRLILPNINDNETLTSLEYRFKSERKKLSQDDIKKKIYEVIGIYKDIFKDKPENLEIWVYKKPLIFSMYRFDDEIIMALNSHSGNPPVPAFRFKGSNGLIYKFLDEEIEYLTNKNSKFSELFKE